MEEEGKHSTSDFPLNQRKATKKELDLHTVQKNERENTKLYNLELECYTTLKNTRAFETTKHTLKATT